MAFVTRFHIEDNAGRIWSGADCGFTRDECMWVQFPDEDEAEEIAASVGGSVERFERYSNRPDMYPGFRLNQAAE